MLCKKYKEIQGNDKTEESTWKPNVNEIKLKNYNRIINIKIKYYDYHIYRAPEIYEIEKKFQASDKPCASPAWH
jgi:hypothetical protein